MAGRGNKEETLVWVKHPDRGGLKISEAVKRETTERLERYAQNHFAGKYTRLDVRFRRQFCYVDVYTKPCVKKNWKSPDGLESREEFIARLRSTPTHLCRLRYFGENRWSFGFFGYSHENYELSIFPSGDFYGPPEQAFAAAASAYLS